MGQHGGRRLSELSETPFKTGSNAMSTWRRKAIDAFPDLRRDFEQPDTSIYDVFIELLARVRDAHARADEPELRNIYDFARWCLHQKADDLRNAAGVAFYEHLVDEPATLNEIPRWLQPDVFETCKNLFEARMEPDEFKELCERYSRRNDNRSI
jgi:hypothetical protein